MKKLSILLAAIAFLAGCAGPQSGDMSGSSGADGFGARSDVHERSNPLNDPTNPYPFYGN